MQNAHLPKVSIVTPSYNQGWCIERTILSVLKQDYPNIQYIVMDSASTDDTARILKKYASRVDFISQKKDKGQSDAINRGFEMASGDILAYLNSDDCYASKSVVRKAVEHLLSPDCPDVVYGRRYFIDKDGFFIKSWPHRDFNAALLDTVCYLPQECAFWTRSMYDRCGGYIDDTLRFAMDYELWLRFLKNGATFKAVDTVFGLFRWHENQKTQDLWQSVAVPEIEGLQRKYGCKRAKDFELQVLFEEYLHQVNLIDQPRLYEKAVRFTQERNLLATKSLAGTPLDLWVYHSPWHQDCLAM